MRASYEVIIIGTGFGGQLAAMNLKQRGIDDFILLERRSFMGGTWSQNAYPGAAVDVQSPLYSIGAEPYDWSQMFAEQSELKQYTEHVIEKHGLRERTLTEHDVERTEWCETDQRWTIHVRGKPSLQAKFIINATGPLSTPVVPDFKGKERFQGQAFHTNAWPAELDLSGKRVAIIGSGASAAQVIPAIAPDCEQLHIFQRSPHWVIPRPDYRFKPWQRRILRKRWAYKFLRVLIYWALETRVLGFKYSKTMLEVLAGRAARKHIETQIDDPELRRKVTPDFTIGCKRVILSNTLYPAYCRENVTLHDKTDGIQEITESGIVSASGQHHELDVIVYSTGYDATDGVISYPVQGRDGRTLSDFWHDFPRAYLGTSVPGFPNLFIVTGPNTGIGHTSAIFVIEAQMAYIMRALEEARAEQSTIEVRADAEDRYTNWVHQHMARTVWQTGGCNSWYKSRSGKVIAMFPGFSFTFRRWAKRFKAGDHHFNRAVTSVSTSDSAGSAVNGDRRVTSG